MKFLGTTTINATLNETFARFADFEYFTKLARQSGTKIRRVDTLASPGPGMSWGADVKFRGKKRNLGIELVDYDPPNALFFKVTVSGIETSFVIDLKRQKKTLTQATITAELAATTLAARLLLRSAKLTKKAMDKRFSARLDWLGHIIEARSKSG